MRMLKTSSADARKVFNHARATDDSAHAFISFMHRNFPVEEFNSYTVQSWKKAAEQLGINVKKLSREAMVKKVREFSGYMDVLRSLDG